MSGTEFDPANLPPQVEALTRGFDRLIGQVALISRRAEELFRSQHRPTNWTAYNDEREQAIQSGAPTWRRVYEGQELYVFYTKGQEVAFIDKGRDGSYGVYLDDSEGVKPHDDGRNVSLLEAIDLAESLASQQATSLS